MGTTQIDCTATDSSGNSVTVPLFTLTVFDCNVGNLCEVPSRNGYQITPPPNDTTVSNDFDNLMELGWQAMDAGDYLLAADLFDQANQIDYENYEVWAGLGAAYHALGDYETAFVLFNEAYYYGDSSQQQDVQYLIDELESILNNDSGQYAGTCLGSVFELDRDVYSPGQDIMLTLIAPNADTDPNNIDLVWVSMYSSDFEYYYGELPMIETGMNTGTFQFGEPDTLDSFVITAPNNENELTVFEFYNDFNLCDYFDYVEPKVDFGTTESILNDDYGQYAGTCLGSAFELDRSVYSPGQDIMLTLIAPNADTDPNYIDVVWVSLYSSDYVEYYGDLPMIETGYNTGIFQFGDPDTLEPFLFTAAYNENELYVIEFYNDFNLCDDSIYIQPQVVFVSNTMLFPNFQVRYYDMP